MLSGSDIVYAVGIAAKFSFNINCTASFGLALENLSHVLVRLFLENYKLSQVGIELAAMPTAWELPKILNLKSVAFRIERSFCK